MRRNPAALARGGLVVVTCWLAGMGPTSAWAQADESHPATPLDVSLTVAGGVSLGAYEAGFLYLQSEALKSVPHRKLRLITGASAGSINALLTALSSCGRPQADPSQDLGFRSWVDTGYEDLFVPEKVDVLNAFSRRALSLAFERVREIWERGLPRSCDIVLGMTTTHCYACWKRSPTPSRMGTRVLCC